MKNIVHVSTFVRYMQNLMATNNASIWNSTYDILAGSGTDFLEANRVKMVMNTLHIDVTNSVESAAIKVRRIMCSQG